jgi:hypothetical protein
MYRFGIVFYKQSGPSRIPQTGLEIRLVRPGDDWDNGVILKENLEGSGYYESDDIEEKDGGLFQVWDDRNGHPAFSGKTTLIGPLDSLGIQEQAVTNAHLAQGSVGADQLQANVISSKQLAPTTVHLGHLCYEAQTETSGKGDISGHTPATLGTDKNAIHDLTGSYDVEPLVILIPQCDYLLYVNQVTVNHGAVRVLVGIGTKGSATAAKYKLLVIKN